VSNILSPRTFPRPTIESWAIELLVAGGALTKSAEIVVDHLVASSSRGVHSHGLMRIPQYLAEMQSGYVDGLAVPTVRAESPTTATIDGGSGLGQVACQAAVEFVVDAAAKGGLAIASVRRIGHSGRIGHYAESLAAAGLVGIACGSGAADGHRVAPFGGREARFATNPLAFAFQPAGQAAVVGDFATSATAEGVVRRYEQSGLQLDHEWLLTTEGQPTTDPHVLYTKPAGTIALLGGTDLGHKGYALTLLVELLATTLGGDTPQDPQRTGSNVFLLGIRPDSGFAQRAQDLCTYIASATPIDPTRPVLLPGEPENAFRQASSMLQIDRATIESMRRLSLELGVSVPHEALDG